MVSAYQSGSNPTDPFRTEPLRIFADADFMANHDRKSRTGWCICFNMSPISYKSALQSIVSLSTAESEVVAACDASKNVIHTRIMLSELDFEDEMKQPTIIHEDNASCVAFAHNLKSRKTTRHFELRVHYLQQLVNDNVVTFRQCPTRHQVADIFTNHCLPLSLKRYALNCLVMHHKWQYWNWSNLRINQLVGVFRVRNRSLTLNHRRASLDQL